MSCCHVSVLLQDEQKSGSTRNTDVEMRLMFSEGAGKAVLFEAYLGELVESSL